MHNMHNGKHLIIKADIYSLPHFCSWGFSQLAQRKMNTGPALAALQTPTNSRANSITSVNISDPQAAISFKPVRYAFENIHKHAQKDLKR